MVLPTEGRRSSQVWHVQLVLVRYDTAADLKLFGVEDLESLALQMPSRIWGLQVVQIGARSLIGLLRRADHYLILLRLLLLPRPSVQLGWPTALGLLPTSFPEAGVSVASHSWRPPRVDRIRLKFRIIFMGGAVGEASLFSEVRRWEVGFLHCEGELLCLVWGVVRFLIRLL